MHRSEKELEGLAIHARDGLIGRVTDTYFDDEEWRTRYVVVDTGKWLNSRRVLLSAAQLRPVAPGNPTLVIDATCDQVRRSPPLDAHRPVSRQQERTLHDYFGWPYYWGASLAGAAVPLAVPPPPPALPPLVPAADRRLNAGVPELPEDLVEPHLRSAYEVRGYHIEASDGTIGHVDDFLLDETSWAIRHLVIDTRNWWPGKKVVVAPRWVQEVRWPDRVVTVALTRSAIESAPEFDAALGVSDGYLETLEHYYEDLGAGRR